jgi:DNA-binding CsgD family transcriptional regulator/PAS domain-containing protein
VAELATSYFKDNWHQRDLRAERGAPLLLRGRTVVTDEDIALPRELERSPFYAENILPHGFAWFAAVGFWAGPALWVISFQRTARDGLPDRRSRQALSELSQRLTEVATLSTAVGRVALVSATSALNAVRCPAIAVDRRGRAVDCNEGAHALFDGDFRIHNTQIVARDKAATAEIALLLARLQNTGGMDTIPNEPIIVRREQKPAIIIRVLPVEAAARGPFLGACAILTLKEAAPKAAPSIPMMMRLFGLTPAEARLVGFMVSGQSVDDVAEILELSRETIRNQLKAVLAKTGTHRQAELVALLSQL